MGEAKSLCAVRAVGGGGAAGRGERGLSEPEPSFTIPAPRPRKRQEVPDFRHYPQPRSAVRPPAPAPGVGARGEAGTARPVAASSL